MEGNLDTIRRGGRLRTASLKVRENEELEQLVATPLEPASPLPSARRSAPTQGAGKRLCDGPLPSAKRARRPAASVPDFDDQDDFNDADDEDGDDDVAAAAAIATPAPRVASSTAPAAPAKNHRQRATRAAAPRDEDDDDDVADAPADRDSEEPSCFEEDDEDDGGPAGTELRVGQELGDAFALAAEVIADSVVPTHFR